MTSSKANIADNCHELDVIGLQCPLPVLKTQKQLKSMESGEYIKVLTSDPAAEIDFPHFCNEAGHALISSTNSDGILTFIIRKIHG